ncbi:MAG: HNH endonuclease [Myxococcales bacterium]|nr:HNH endonuclease [Myxococcales bacterium]
MPVDVQREVRERDADRCTFTDAAGRRCSETRFLTIEHIVPFAKGGPTTVDNCCLLCSAHNSYRARQVFGEEHIQNEIAGARARREANRTPEVQSASPTPPVPPPAVAAAPSSRCSRRCARRWCSRGSSGPRLGKPSSRCDCAGSSLGRTPASRRDRRAHALRQSGHTPQRRAGRCSWSRQRQRRGHECERERSAS